MFMTTVESIHILLNQFKAAKMQNDAIQTFLNKFNGLENTSLSSGSSPNHPKNPYFDFQHTQNDKNHFPRFKYTI